MIIQAVQSVNSMLLPLFFYSSSTLWFGSHNTGRSYSHVIMLYFV